MDFIGKDGIAAPRLKDAGLVGSKLAEAYSEVVYLMRGMFIGCRLVHADLSEYNMLYWQGHVMLIDVSQSVETDHPRALEFLRMVRLALPQLHPTPYSPCRAASESIVVAELPVASSLSLSGLPKCVRLLSARGHSGHDHARAL
jgi:hypothetical protein